MRRRFLVLLVLAVWAACARPTPTLILISFDGFRWDYLERYPAPEFQRLLARGSHAEASIPPFPSKTFPSHYTIVTGLYPAHHGIIANTMYDPALNARFSLANRAAVEDPRWWAGEPIWVTGERQGHATGSLFWPGSETTIHGVQPRYWARYDETMTNEKVIDTTLGWLDKPASERPVFIGLYFNDTDDAGHRDGPHAPSVRTAVEHLDETLGLLRAGLERRGVADAVNIIVTSDHGMTEVSRERVIVLDDYIDLASVEVVDWSPVLSLSARDGNHESVYQKLSAANPHLHVYRKAEMPERLHFRDNARITPIVGIADEGWTITSRAALPRDGGELTSLGAHGYDNALPSMHGILIAAGPAFKRGAVIPAVENVNIYELMCHVLGFTPAPNDGSLEPLRPLLR